MILVSFSSAEDALSNDIKKYKNFSSQGTENPPFRFFWDTWYKNCNANGCKLCTHVWCTCMHLYILVVNSPSRKSINDCWDQSP